MTTTPDPTELVRRLRANGALTAAEHCRKKIRIFANWLQDGVIDNEMFEILRDVELIKLRNRR